MYETLVAVFCTHTKRISQKAMSQFPVNCSNFTAHQSRVLNLTRSVTASVCLVVILLIIVLLFFYRAYESTLQRLFFYLSTVTLIYEIANVLQMEHLWQYHQQKKLCAYLGFCDQWTVAMVYLSTIQINIFLMYKVYEQFRGALCPSISHSQRCRIVLEICSVLCVVLIPCAYLWKPLLDGNFGIAGAWCWMRTLDEDCVSVGFLDQVFFAYVLRGVTHVFNLISILLLAAIFYQLARNYRGVRRQHLNTVIKTLLLMVFLLVSFVFDAFEIKVRLWTGLAHRRELYSLWVVYAMGPPISKLAFPVGFLLYLYSIKKFSREAIERAASKWKSCCPCCECCKRAHRRHYHFITAQDNPTAPFSHPVSVPSATMSHPPYTDGFTEIEAVEELQSVATSHHMQ